MKITDEMLAHAAPHACDLWLDTVADAVPHQTASRRFEQQMARLLRRPHGRVGVRTLLIAALIAAFLTMTAGAEVLPPVRAFRSGVVHVLNQVFPKSTDQIYTTDADHEGETRRPVLNWLPEGMAEVKRVEQPEYTHLCFEDNNNRTLVLYFRRITNNASVSASFDTEDAQVTEIFINENSGTLAVEQDRTRLIFFVDNYRCSLSGILTADEAVKIAENIILK